MDPLTMTMLLSALQLGAGLYKQKQEKQREEQDYADSVKANRRAAIERSLGRSSLLAGPTPRKPLDTEMAETIGGVAQAGQSLKWDKLFNKKPGEKNAY